MIRFHIPEDIEGQLLGLIDVRNVFFLSSGGPNFVGQIDSELVVPDVLFYAVQPLQKCSLTSFALF